MHLVLGHGTASGQQTALLRLPAACETCRITLQQRTVISDVGGVAAFDDFVNISRDPAGRFYIVSPLALYQVAVFDSTGKFLTVLGAAGGGPGEYRLLMPPVFDRSGQIYLVDLGSLRYTVLSADHAIVASYRFPPIRFFDALAIGDGVLLASGLNRTTDGFGLPLHRLKDGSVLQSFGSTNGTFELSMAGTLDRYLIPRGADSFIAVAKHSYGIEFWSGTTLLSVLQRPDSQAYKDAPRGNIATTPPAPRLTGAWIDGDGHLWLLTGLAAADYRPVTTRSQTGGEPIVRLTGRDREAIWDSVLEVIDLEQHTVLARQRFKEFMVHVRGSAFVHVYRSTSSGEPQFVIYVPTLTGSTARGGAR
jgi:hypothetical protein